MIDFFQHVRTVYLRAEAEGRAYHPIGEDTLPEQEPVRFSAHNTLAFPATGITRVIPPKKPGEPQKVQVSFMGLTGASGILPDHYTSQVIARLQAIEPIYARWPLQGERQTVSITLTGFDGKNHSLTFSGPWAWFKMLKATRITAVGNAGFYRWTFATQEGLTAVFDVSASNSMPLFNLDVFEQLKLPEKL
jgi:hypothetical protein